MAGERCTNHRRGPHVGADHGTWLPETDWDDSGVRWRPPLAAASVLIVEAKEKNALVSFRRWRSELEKITEDRRIIGFWYMSEIFVDPKNPDVSVCAFAKLVPFEDAGTTLRHQGRSRRRRLPHAMDRSDEFAANHARRGSGRDDQPQRRRSWSTWYNQPTGQFYRVATDHRFSILGVRTQQDSGTRASPAAETTDKSRSATGFRWSGRKRYTIPDLLDADVVYNAGAGGSVVRMSKPRDRCGIFLLRRSRWQQVPFQLDDSTAFSPQDPHLLYLGTQFLLKTADAGTSWQAVSPDLTRTRADEKNRNRCLARS